MDLLESQAKLGQPHFTHVIVPQTVLDEVRHRSLPLYNRLQAMLDDPEGAWARFWNEACR
jgi:exosome complex exonuclease DIS3/RRP44